MTFEDLIQRMKERGLPRGGVQYRYKYFTETIAKKNSIDGNPYTTMNWLVAFGESQKAFEHLNGIRDFAEVIGFISEDESKSIFENLLEMVRKNEKG